MITICCAGVTISLALGIRLRNGGNLTNAEIVKAEAKGIKTDVDCSIQIQDVEDVKMKTHLGLLGNYEYKTALFNNQNTSVIVGELNSQIEVKVGSVLDNQYIANTDDLISLKRYDILKMYNMEKSV